MAETPPNTGYNGAPSPYDIGDTQPIIWPNYDPSSHAEIEPASLELQLHGLDLISGSDEIGGIAAYRGEYPEDHHGLSPVVLGSMSADQLLAAMPYDLGQRQADGTPVNEEIAEHLAQTRTQRIVDAQIRDFVAGVEECKSFFKVLAAGTHIGTYSADEQKQIASNNSVVAARLDEARTFAATAQQQGLTLTDRQQQIMDVVIEQYENRDAAPFDSTLYSPPEVWRFKDVRSATYGPNGPQNPTDVRLLISKQGGPANWIVERLMESRVEPNAPLDQRQDFIETLATGLTKIETFGELTLEQLETTAKYLRVFTSAENAHKYGMTAEQRSSIGSTLLRINSAIGTAPKEKKHERPVPEDPGLRLVKQFLHEGRTASTADGTTEIVPAKQRWIKQGVGRKIFSDGSDQQQRNSEELMAYLRAPEVRNSSQALAYIAENRLVHDNAPAAAKRAAERLKELEAYEAQVRYEQRIDDAIARSGTEERSGRMYDTLSRFYWNRRRSVDHEVLLANNQTPQRPRDPTNLSEGNRHFTKEELKDLEDHFKQTDKLEDWIIEEIARSPSGDTKKQWILRLMSYLTPPDHERVVPGIPLVRQPRNIRRLNAIGFIEGIDIKQQRDSQRPAPRPRNPRNART